MPHVLLTARHTGQVLKHLRTVRGLTQTDLARKLYISYKTALRREHGDADLRLGSLIDAAAVFDYDVVLQKRRRPGARPTGTGWPT